MAAFLLLLFAKYCFVAFSYKLWFSWEKKVLLVLIDWAKLRLVSLALSFLMCGGVCQGESGCEFTVLSFQEEIEVKKDTERADEIRAMKKAWEDADPGRAAKVFDSELMHLLSGLVGRKLVIPAGVLSGLVGKKLVTLHSHKCIYTPPPTHPHPNKVRVVYWNHHVHLSVCLSFCPCVQLCSEDIF